MTSSENLLNSRHKFQSTAEIDKYGNYISGNRYYLPNLEYYTEAQAFDFLRTFDCPTRIIRQQILNHYNSRSTQLSSLPGNIEYRNRKILKDSIPLLELTFKYTI